MKEKKKKVNTDAQKKERISLKDRWKGIERKQKIILSACMLLLVAALASGGIYFFVIRNNAKDMADMRPDMNGFGENIVTASGLTSTGMTEEEYELDFLETQLFVEESYLSMGDTVEKGTKAFKISDESLKEAKEELKNAAAETELAYRQGLIDYERNKLEADSTYQTAEVNAKYAQAEYDSSLEQSKADVEDLKQQAEDAQELYDEYTAVVKSDYYYSYYNIEELKSVYYDNFSFLMDLYERWDIEGLNDQYPNGAGSLSDTGTSQSPDSASTAAQSDSGASGSTGGMPGGGMSGSGKSEGSSASSEADKLTVYDMMDELVTENGEEYEEAMDNYKKDTAMATASLDQAKSNLATLQARLQEAELAYEKQVIMSKVDYDSTIADSENAKLVYDTTVKKLDEDLEALKDDEADAKDNLQIFESTMGDGYFYTQSAGTIVMNRVRKGSYLGTEDILLAYSDPETVTVAASVDQADIAPVNVGDSAYVVISEYGSYEGTVISINPVSSSDSKSAVTYTVTVELSGDMSNLESNLTSYVYLGMNEEQMEQMQRRNARSADGNAGAEMRDDNMPEGNSETNNTESGNQERTNGRPQGSAENEESPGSIGGAEGAGTSPSVDVQGTGENEQGSGGGNGE
ncbi:HlyD family secretion protein [Kineothrix alysoides]|uniref:HlyD family secretion protein n=1 Tax=Kineothrix alysoides TaxID=1469948 RepID=A0A4R1R6L5_9FIRM|nr:HlyD family efflux transporter periplasmic adaptor subunit [Kineothrix alysoides]TCL60952.1 HlyD family secretion protein [Kineothrix alysoides]